jgi:hypothetical protein
VPEPLACPPQAVTVTANAITPAITDAGRPDLLVSFMSRNPSPLGVYRESAIRSSDRLVPPGMQRESQ